MDLELRVLHAYWQHNLMSQKLRAFAHKRESFDGKQCTRCFFKGVERNDLL